MRLMTLEEQFQDQLKKDIPWPSKVKLLRAEDIIRGYPMRDESGRACMTGWASNMFLGQEHCLPYDTFRMAFRVLTAKHTDPHGRPYTGMGPFNDDGKQSEEEIANTFNEALKLCGYNEQGERAA